MNRTIQIFTQLSLMISFLILCASFSAMAQDSEGLKPLPEVQEMNAETFVNETRIVNKAFEDDEFLQFEYQIHKDWEEKELINLKNILKNKRLYGTVAEHIGPVLGDVTPYFRVTTKEIDREISVRNWLINFVLNQGYTLKALDVQPEENTFEALYVSRSNIDSYVVRAKGYKLGPRMVLAEYAVPVKYWKDYRDYQTLVIKSVAFRGDDSRTVEERKYFAYLDAIDFAFPESWRAQDEVVYGPNKLRVTVFNSIDGQIVQGKITVHVISARSVKDLDDFRVYDINLKDNLQDIQGSITKEYDMRDLIEKKTYNVPENVKFQMTDIYNISPIETEYVSYEQEEITSELWFSVFLKGYTYYIVTMITPARGRDAYVWSVNSEAYKIIAESLVRERKIEPSDFYE